MISGIFHSGSGCGNQLFRYITARTLALDKGYYFSMVAPENFKGKSFMNLNMGISLNLPYATDTKTGEVIPFESRPSEIPDRVRSKVWEEKAVIVDCLDIRSYDPEINFVEDNTIIDGEFQDIRYWGHRMEEINEWLKVESIEVPEDVCVIGFRGGEFALYPDLFLTHEYWQQAMKEMISINPGMKFEVHTDDALLAREFFKFDPHIKIIQDIGINWRSMRYAKHAIIANSSFYILPRLLNGGITIAPKYWARPNTKTWCLPQNYYSCFMYL